MKKYALGLVSVLALVSCSIDNRASKNVDKTEISSKKDELKTIWDLSDLYNSPSDENIEKDKREIERLVQSFRKTYKGRVSVANLKKTIREYEKISDLMGKLDMYAFLLSSVNKNNPKIMAFFQSTSELLSRINSELAFFINEINRLPIEGLKKEMSRDKELAEYEPWISDVIRYKAHKLSDGAEEAVAQKDLTAAEAWRRLYDEIMTRLKADFRGEKRRVSDLADIVQNSNDPQEREEAYKAIRKKLSRENFYIKHIYNNILLNWSTETKLRNYQKPESIRHVSNDIDQKTVDAMVGAVVESCPKISHRYFKIKAKLLGKEKLDPWDVYAPINLSSLSNKKYSYADATKIVLDTFGKFSGSFQDIASKYIENGWIDVYPRDGKRNGGFMADSNSRYAHPYILLNYRGRFDDVSTLAHELGHGVHSVLCLRNNKPFILNTPITLSETASTFAQHLLFEEAYKSASNVREKIDMLCWGIEDLIAYICLTISKFEFEREAHSLRAKRELTNADLSKLYAKYLRKYLGSGVKVDACNNNWSRVLHFFHYPFYVYGYAFGALYTSALFECYKQNPAGFVNKYIAMLSRGGIDRYDVAASKFGLDPSKKEFWKSGLKRLEQQVDELEKLQKTLKN
jgi:oligoendopeptidase F